MPTEQAIREATPEQLRVWIAEALGLVWWCRGGTGYTALPADDTETPRYWRKERPPTDGLEGRISRDVPDWPGDITAAIQLANEIQAEWDKMPHVGHFRLYWHIVTHGNGLWGAQVRTANCSESRPWIMPVHAANLAEAICQIWLIAKFALDEVTDAESRTSDSIH